METEIPHRQNQAGHEADELRAGGASPAVRRHRRRLVYVLLAPWHRLQFPLPPSKRRFRGSGKTGKWEENGLEFKGAALKPARCVM